MNPAKFKSGLMSIIKLPVNARQVLQTAILSLAAASGAVLFMVFINLLYKILYVKASTASKTTFIGLSFLFTMTSSFLVSLLLRKVPSAAGSGIPQVKAAYWKELGYIPIRDVITKFIAGIISVGGGASLGREGPTIFLGSGVASFLSGYTGSAKRQRRAATAIGASAGLAAAFNTPLAAITFSVEELINDLNTRYLGRVVLASLFGALTVYTLVGKQPAFLLPQVNSGSVTNFFLIPLVALVASVLGVIFQKLILHFRPLIRKPGKFPVWLNPCIGGLITWIIGITVFLVTGKIGIFGLGYDDLSESLVNGTVWWIAGILVLGKFLATIVSYSFGGCGGIFSPTLFIGGMCGAFLSAVAALWFPGSPNDHVILSTVGMSACLGAVIRAPLTSTLIVFEMTHQFEIIPGLMLSAVISQFVARFAGIKHNFYDDLLLQDGHELLKIKPPRDLYSWQNLPVSNIMNKKPVIIKSTDYRYLKSIISSTPYKCFPYVENGKITGILTREAIISSLSGGQQIVPSDACVSDPDTTVKEAADQFICSPHNFLIIANQDKSSIEGILTLNDLLRAQTAASE